MEYNPESTLFRTAEAARILNVSHAMASQLMQRGEIRSVRIGAARRVRREDLSLYIQQSLSPAANANLIGTNAGAGHSIIVE